MTEHEPLQESPGRLLAGARIRAGLTLGEVAARSRIPQSALEAIEADDWRRLPAMVYLRGFVRLYAREVGVAPEVPIALLDAVLAERDQADETAHARAEAELRARRMIAMRTRAAYTVALSALVGVLLLAWFSVSSGPTAARNLSPDAAPTAAPAEPTPAAPTPAASEARPTED